jgi:succinate dehydrogenase hydrophobic anchor subunit
MFLKLNWREVLNFLVLFALLVLASRAVGYLWPEAGIIDAGGLLQIVIAGMFKLSGCVLAAYLVLHYALPSIAEPLDAGKLKEWFAELPEKWRAVVSLCVILFLIGLCALLQ